LLHGNTNKLCNTFTKVESSQQIYNIISTRAVQLTVRFVVQHGHNKLKWWSLALSRR